MVSYIFNRVWKVNLLWNIVYSVHTYNVCAVLCLLYVNPLEKSPPPPPLYMLQTILLCISSIF
jgi:hypothetical protein